MNKRTSPSAAPSSASSRIKLSLRRASLRELTHADLTSVGGGTVSRIGVIGCMPEEQNPI